MRTIGIVLALTLTSTFAYAHPGRTASDGCHYCRTNCDRWGVPWNQRHCHYKAEPESLEEGLLKVSSPTKTYGLDYDHGAGVSHTHSHSEDGEPLVHEKHSH